MQDMQHTMDHDRIRERAYAIWESEGCPDGCADQHWSAAEAEALQSGESSEQALRLAPAPDTTDAELQANGYGQPDDPATERRALRRRA